MDYGKSMHNYYLGHKYKQKDADKIEHYLAKALEGGEAIRGIFPANGVFPTIDTIVITNMRLICFAISSLDRDGGVKKEVVGDMTATVEVKHSKYASLLPLRIHLRNGEEMKACNIRKEDADEIVKMVQEMKGRPVSVSEAIQANADREAELRSLEEERMLARKADIIRAIEKSEDLRTDREKALLETEAGKILMRKANEALVARHDASQNVSAADGSGGFCPKCGSDRLQAIQEVNTKGVSTSASAAGCCFLGPLGLLCGLPGAGKSTTKTMRMCLNCGKKFE